MKKFTVGRFQTDEPSPGHRRILDMLSSGDVVFIGSCNAPFSDRNPLDYMTRFRMLRQRYPLLDIRMLNDYHDDEMWAKVIDASLGDGVWVGLSGPDGFVHRYIDSGGKNPVGILKQKSALSESTRRREGIGQEERIDNMDKRRAIIWQSQQLYPHVFPTVDIVCMRGKEVLLVKKPLEKQWRFPGGFVDVNDPSLLHAAVREFREEVPNIEAGRWEFITSFKVNDWRYSGKQGIMTSVFVCEYLWGYPSAGDDVSEAKWVRTDEIRQSDIVDEHQPILECVQ